MTKKEYLIDQAFIISLCALIFIGCYWIIHPKPTYDQWAIRAIVGEASNQSEYTMLCVADAIRNRGNLKGVYGLYAEHNDRESPTTWVKAERAWVRSAKEVDMTGGAKNWGTWDDLLKEGETAAFHVQCGDLYFY